MKKIISIVLKSVTVAMGVAVVVLSTLGGIDIGAAVSMLGIGVACAGLASLHDAKS